METKEMIETVEQSIEDQGGDVKTVKYNIIPKDNFVLIIMTMVFLQLCLLCWMFLSRGGKADNQNTLKPATDLQAKDVLRRIHLAGSLRSMICLISFDEDHTEDYLTLLRTKITKEVKVQTHVIRRHQDICTLPQCQMYIMFAEFTERHVIIEQPGLGLGDLKRTTYDVVQKLGGGVVIVYYRDPGSRALPPNLMYNKDIYCVDTQPELQNLHQQGRFLSVYNSFTDVQSEALRRAVRAILNKRI